jgi:hypothetical protein
MFPEPGRLTSLGTDEDRIDAGSLLEVCRACEPVRDRRKAGTTNVVRQALWNMWELPRIPRPLMVNKYPPSYPWSPAARAAVQSTGAPLVGGASWCLNTSVP